MGQQGAGVQLNIQRSSGPLVELAILRTACASASISGEIAVPQPATAPATEARVEALVPQEMSETQARLSTAAASMGLSSAHFWRVPSDYYDHELEWRRAVLGAASTKQLCKSMIME